MPLSPMSIYKLKGQTMFRMDEEDQAIKEEKRREGNEEAVEFEKAYMDG